MLMQLTCKLFIVTEPAYLQYFCELSLLLLVSKYVLLQVILHFDCFTALSVVFITCAIYVLFSMLPRFIMFTFYICYVWH